MPLAWVRMCPVLRYQAEYSFRSPGAIWELNYRGARPFLHQARAQQAARNLTVVDGWKFFLYGWSSVMSLVLDIPLTSDRFDRFSAATRR